LSGEVPYAKSVFRGESKEQRWSAINAFGWNKL
jgi:hypothetical protein